MTHSNNSMVLHTHTHTGSCSQWLELLPGRGTQEQVIPHSYRGL